MDMNKIKSKLVRFDILISDVLAYCSNEWKFSFKLNFISNTSHVYNDTEVPRLLQHMLEMPTITLHAASCCAMECCHGTHPISFLRPTTASI